MHDNARAKFGFVLRQYERRLRALEERLGLPSPKNPLNDPALGPTDRPMAETKETTDEQHSNR